MTRLDWFPWKLLKLLVGAYSVSLVAASLCKAEEAPPAMEPISAQIRRIVGEGRLSQLRWNRFPDVQAWLDQTYQKVNFAPLWMRDGKPTAQAAQMIETLSGADEHGLNPEDYEAERLRKWSAEIGSASTATQAAAFDVALNVAALRYVSSLSGGRINPRRVNFAIDSDAKRPDASDLVSRVASGEDPKAVIASIEPQHPAYRGLKQALSRYRTWKTEIAASRFEFPVSFRPGGHHRDIAGLRRHLLALGDLNEIKPDLADSDLYDPDLADAVGRFQQRHGLAADGIIGKGTLVQLNASPGRQAEKIKLAMERIRWLPNDMSGLYLVVNIPSFQLYGSRNGHGFGDHDIEMNVIVGKAVAGRKTPVFNADMTFVVFHPYWNVPGTIAIKELLPAIRRNPGYLARNNMELVGKSGRAVSAASIEGLASGSVRIRQRPGAANALGLVKFSFPNNNNVYLHSTPSRGLFQRARRDFSHGCIRVQDPVRLAEWVLAEQPEWTRPRIEAAMKSAGEKTVTLDQPIPVYIFYSTATADRDGRVQFYEDIYGLDQPLLDLLAKGYPYHEGHSDATLARQ